MSKIIEIELPLDAKHRKERAAVYSLYTTGKIKENNERGKLVSGRSSTWSNMKMPIYISRNLERPRCKCDSGAKIGLCLVINIGEKSLRERIKGIVLTTLKKKWRSIQSNKRYDIRVVVDEASTDKDLETLESLLSNEIENALIKEGILVE